MEQPRGRGRPGDRVPLADHVPGVLCHRRGPRVRRPAVRHHRRLPEDGHQALVGRDPRPGGPHQGRQDPEEQEAGPAHDAHRGGGVFAVLGTMAGLITYHCQARVQVPLGIKATIQAMPTLGLYLSSVFQVYLVASIIHPSINTWKYVNIMFFAFHWLAMSSSCYNPFIYGIYSEKFKREFRIRLTCSIFGAPSSPNESIEMQEIRQIMFRLVK